MKKYIKNITIIVLLLITFLNTFADNANAEEQNAKFNDSDIVFDIITDKDTYKNGEDITFTINIKNISQTSITDSEISLDFPQFIILADGQSNKININDFNIGKEITYTYTGKIDMSKYDSGFSNNEDNNIDNIEIPKTEVTITDITSTGESNNIIIYTICILISGVIILLIVKKKNWKKIVSIFLCTSIIINIIFTPEIIEAEDEPTKDIQYTSYAVFRNKSQYINESIIIDNKNYNYDISIKYNTNDKLSINLENLNNDNENNRYILNDNINILQGTLTNSQDVKSFKYYIYDKSGNEIKSNEIIPLDEWTINNIGLIVGENNLNIVCIYNDSSEIKGNIKIFNTNQDNMNNIDVDKNDNDNDGVLNYIENEYGTDKNNPDTDGDGLDDYEEIQILGTNPLEKDTDNNGINDGDEDFDNDGVSNIAELRNKTNPLASDSDGDGFNDKIEMEIKTDPLKTDTDNDGASDYWEYINGYDPLIFNSNFEIDNKYKMEENISIGVKATFSGENAQSLNVEKDNRNNLFNSTMPGYICKAYNFSTAESFDSAVISFEYPEELMNEENFVPAIYYYNEDSGLLEELNTNIEGHTASATVKHFSTYILLNKTNYERVWNEEIASFNPSSKSNKMDFVFVIDYSKSMDDNDPKGLRKELTNDFIDKLNATSNASIVKFAKYATQLTQLINDKETLKNAVNSITNNDGTSCSGEAGTNGSDGINMALSILNKSEADYKCIIFMTDGEDTDYSYEYSDLITQAQNENVNIYTIGLGTANEKLLKQIASDTNGKFYYAIDEELKDTFEKIEGDTVDIITDSNNDGISDYLTKKICNGEIKTGTLAKVFNYGEEYLINEAGPDYDNDGLINGDEIEVKQTESGKMYIKLKSNPKDPDSDGDGYNDYEEIKKFNTDPLMANSIIYDNDLDYVSNYSNFVSEKYRNVYINDAGERGTVFVGNTITGSNYNYIQLCEKSLIDYFEYIGMTTDDNSEANSECTFDTFMMIKDVVNQLNDVASAAIDKLKLKKENEELINEINKCNVEATSVLYDISKIKGNTALARQKANKLFADYSAILEKAGQDKGKYIITGTIIQSNDSINNIIAKINDFQTIYEDISDFNKIIGNIDFIKNKIYILDCIINYNENNDKFSLNTNYELQDAAKNIKNVVLKDYNNKVDIVTTFMASYGCDFIINKKIDDLKDIVEKLVLNSDYKKFVIKVIDWITGVSDIAPEAVYTYATATVSNILNENYQEYIKNTLIHKTNYNIWADYTKDWMLSYSKFTDSLSIRYCAESHMIDYDSHGIFKYITSNFQYKKNICEKNCSKLDQLIYTYK